ncbi:MAG TPA: hypothetical protein DDY52_03315 [Candidatus Moranbacteria bacterium]|nr:hypothetical protein [Candidatus Moranbacteria bacterium]
MNKEEIKKVKAEVTKAENEKTDHVAEEEALYTMSESEGWKIMVKKANKTICELLEPVDTTNLSDNANHILILANTFANAKALKMLREFVNEVELIKKVRRESETRKQGEPKPVAQ